MDNIKTIKIKDIDIEYTFEVRLFKVKEGVSFFSNYLGENKIKEEAIYKLLTLATLIREIGNEKKRIPFDIEQAETIFKSPMSVMELATEILNFQQEVFLNSKS